MMRRYLRNVSARYSYWYFTEYRYRIDANSKTATDAFFKYSATEGKKLVREAVWASIAGNVVSFCLGAVITAIIYAVIRLL